MVKRRSLAYMPASAPTIVATTMGFCRDYGPGGRAWTPGPVFELLWQLASRPERPRVCLLATAGGDHPATIAGFYGAFSGSDVRASHLALFDKPNIGDIGSHLRAQDVIWVDRGSMANLMAVWRAHGLDAVLRQCWRSGVVLAGESAGSLCWHRAGPTDSFGSGLVVETALGLLPYGNAVHYEAWSGQIAKLASQGLLPDLTYATTTGAGLVYRDTELVEAVADRASAAAYRIRLVDGKPVETALEVRRLR